jgi:hypothetical protein
MFLTIDVSTGIVTMSIGTFQAQVLPDSIIWRSPAANLGGGGYRPATDYVFNRATGELHLSGSDFVRVAYCQRGARPAPVL